MPRLTHDRYDAELRAETARFAAAVEDADPARPVALASDLAADRVSDLLDLFSTLPRIDDFPALSQLRGHGQTLHFHATDPELGLAGEWLAHRAPSGVEWEHRHATTDAACADPRWPAAGPEPPCPAGRLAAPSLGRPRAARPLAGAQPPGTRLTRPTRFAPPWAA